MRERTPPPHYEALDGIRGVAALLVVFAHFNGLFNVRNGWIGVDIFFVLSGFLITRILSAELADTGRIRFGRFYARRALRLVPALVCLVAVVSLIDLTLHLYPKHTLLLSAIAAVTYTSNWVRALDLWDMTDFAHTWTLSIEEQFYLSWPLVLVLLTAVTGRAWRIYSVALAAFGAYLLRAHLIAEGAADDWIWNAFQTRAGALLVGVTTALAVEQWGLPSTQTGRWTLFASAIVGCLAVLFVVTYQTSPDIYLLWLEPMVTVGTAAILVHLVADKASPITRGFSVAPLTMIGKVSYGLYLWHFPIWLIVWKELAPFGLSDDTARSIDLFALLPLALLACWVSYRYVESPFLAMKDGLARARKAQTMS